MVYHSCHHVSFAADGSLSSSPSCACWVGSPPPRSPWRLFAATGIPKKSGRARPRPDFPFSRIEDVFVKKALSTYFVPSSTRQFSLPIEGGGTSGSRDQFSTRTDGSCVNHESSDDGSGTRIRKREEDGGGYNRNKGRRTLVDLVELLHESEDPLWDLLRFEVRHVRSRGGENNPRSTLYSRIGILTQFLVRVEVTPLSTSGVARHLIQGPIHFFNYKK